MIKGPAHNGILGMDAAHLNSLAFLQDKLGIIGRVKPIGSALRSKAFVRGHDYDIKLYTDIPSKDYLVHRIREVAEIWPPLLLLHVFVVGDFTPSVVQDKVCLIHFTGRFSGKVLWLSILWQKFLVSLSKRYTSTIKTF